MGRDPGQGGGLMEPRVLFLDNALRFLVTSGADVREIAGVSGPQRKVGMDIHMGKSSAQR